MKPASIQFLYSHGTGAVERLGTYFGKKTLFVWGWAGRSGCGAVGRAVATDTSDPQISNLVVTKFY